MIARLRPQERAQLSDVENLYVYSSQGSQKVPLRTVSSVANEMVTERIRRQDHFRTIGVYAFPQPGVSGIRDFEPGDAAAHRLPKN